MAEVLGRRSLLGVGVLLAWLVLFHLLVNIWLLCVFTSLLVVLGGWLGSQAVLESNSLVHLERFISLNPISSSVEDEEQLDQEIQNTVMKIIRDFVSSWYSTISTERAFEIDVHEAMISMAMELKTRARLVDQKALSERLLDLYGGHLQKFLRATQLVAEQPSDASNRLWKVYTELEPPHPAVKSAAVEHNYTRAVVDLLLHSLVPPPNLESTTGRFVVGELITCNVLLPFFTKVSEPDWLNVLLVQLFTSPSVLAAEPVESSSAQPPQRHSTPVPPVPPSAPPSARSEVPPKEEETTAPRPTEQTMSASPSYAVASEVDTHSASDTDTPTDNLHSVSCDTVDSELYSPQNIIEEVEHCRRLLRNYVRPCKSNPFYQENDSDLESPLADYKRDSLDSLITDGQEGSQSDLPRECATPTDCLDLDLDVDPGHVDEMGPEALLHSQPLDQVDGCGPSCLRPAQGSPGPTRSLHLPDPVGSPVSTNPARELFLGLEGAPGTPGTPNELAPAIASLVPSSRPSFSFEPLSSPEGPVLIQNLRITGTITAKEHRGTGSHPYTLYTIKYETVVYCEAAAHLQPGCEEGDPAQGPGDGPGPADGPGAGPPVAYHTVNRRYSEFLNLQTRLEEKQELRKLIKGVKGPKKIFPDMPFGNMDSDKIEARKGLLETFLKHLCSIHEAANSEEMQEFLALNTDARIAFVKKPFIVSRIDKIVVNAIVDTLKTAFPPRSEPQSPTEDNEGEMDGGKMNPDKKNRSRLRFSSKNNPYVNGSDLRPRVTFCFEQSNTMFSGMSLARLQALLTGQEGPEPEWGVGGQVRGGEPCVHVDRSPKATPRAQPGCEMALAEPALSIVCLLMAGQWGWLCTENVQRTVRMLFGTLIDRWLEVSVANLTSMQYWVTYLQIIQEAVWPGGVLPAEPWPLRTPLERDNSRQQALLGLMGVVPDLVSELLGSDKYRLSWQTALDSLQDPYINRHLLYCILDLLLEFLFPDIPEEDFQRILLQSLSKATEGPAV
ncbi:sorting nexin-19 isoform X1 [Gadus macrocephalus]|uniref:sorting nexin-19 isoform X1 n=2 Tax=Gadus macrocephalus TaxID=80720 RepID=UPI0028CB592B|nr:sorting nexin-19 isoform X1 [Gadus macrocephalus]